MVLIGFVVALVLYQGFQFIGFLLCAFQARRYGVVCEEIGLGFGPSLATFKLNSIPISLKLIPYGGYSKFPDAESEQLEALGSRAFSLLPLSVRILHVLICPLVLLVAGFILIQLAILLPDSNLVIAKNDALKAVTVVDYPAVPGLSTTGTSLTWGTAVELFYDAIIEFWVRYFTLGSLEKWSGAIGWMVMSGGLCFSHPGAFISALGMICWSGFLMNLAPVPTFPGGMVVVFLADNFGFNVQQSAKVILSGIAITIFIGLGMLFLDFRWFHVIFGLQ